MLTIASITDHAAWNTCGVIIAVLGLALFLLIDREQLVAAAKRSRTLADNTLVLRFVIGSAVSGVCYGLFLSLLLLFYTLFRQIGLGDPISMLSALPIAGVMSYFTIMRLSRFQFPFASTNPSIVFFAAFVALTGIAILSTMSAANPIWSVIGTMISIVALVLALLTANDKLILLWRQHAVPIARRWRLPLALAVLWFIFCSWWFWHFTAPTTAVFAASFTTLFLFKGLKTLVDDPPLIISQTVGVVGLALAVLIGPAVMLATTAVGLSVMRYYGLIVA